MEQPDDLLTRVAEAVSDGTPIDWDGEKRGQPSLRGILQRLHVLGKIRDVHQSPDAVTATVGAEATQSGSSSSALALEAWGSLRILGKAGEGNFGEVYRAYDPALDSEVALKILKVPDPISQKAIDDFLSEARRLARVRHPNIITVHGADVRGGKPGIWLDYVRGKTLEALLQEPGPLNAHEASLIGIDLCRALAALHAAGFVHCDLKTTNVMREEGGRILLMDFGSVGRITGPESLGDTRAVQGTLIAMAPEQLRGEAVGPTTDIYALGVLLYRLVTVRYPIEGASYADFLERHRRGALVGLRDRRANLPSGFIDVVHRALAPDPKDRFATAGEMERALAGTLVPHDPKRRDESWGWFRRLRVEVRVLVTVTVLAVLIGVPLFVQRLATNDSGQAGPMTGGDRSPARVALTANATIHRLTEKGAERLLPGNRISPGDKLFMEIQGTDSMSVYVLNEDANGNVFVLFPLGGVSPSNPLQPGVRYQLPGQSREKTLFWNVTSPGRQETILAIASRRPMLELEKEIELFPHAVPGRPVTYGKVPQSVLHSLRGIGGLKAEDPPPTPPGSALSNALKALEDRSRRTGELWVWQIQLENP